jgi:hypothetical protein
MARAWGRAGSFINREDCAPDLGSPAVRPIKRLTTPS